MPAASSLTLWILGAVFLAGGFAAGYVAGQGSEDALPDDEGPLLERATASPPAASPVVTLERPAVTEEEEARLESARAAELEPLRRMLAGMDPPEIPRGNGVVTGTVKTPDGTGLAGVEVTLTPRQRRPGAPRPGAWEEPEDLTVAVKDAIDGVLWRRLARQRTVTAGDGAYRFDAVADLDHTVQAKLAGWQIHLADPRRGYRVRPGATIDFLAKTVVEVAVTIVLPDGSTPEHATVMMKRGGMHTGTGWQRTNPVVLLEPGTWELTVQAGDARQYKSKPRTVVVEKGVQPSPLSFELSSKGTVHGRVEYAPGENFQQGRVYVARIPKGAEPDPALLASSTHNTYLHTWRGSAPTFTFSDLAPGRYLVGLSRTYQGSVVITEEIEVSDEAVEVVLKVPPLDREEYVVVRILDPEGQPVAGAQVSTGVRHGTGSRSGGTTAVDREDGSKWVLHQPGSGTDGQNATWWIEATHPAYGTKREEYERGRASAVDVRFARPGTVEVTVTGVAGTRYEGRIHATLEGQGTRSRGGQALELGADGRLTFPGVQAGTYSVVLSVGGQRGRRSEILREKTEIQPGTNRLRLELPPLYEVEIQGATGTVWIRSTAKGRRFSANVPVTGKGRATVDALPAGEYEARSGSRRAKFTLPGATTVQLE